MTMRLHPFCKLFPEITGEDFKAFVADIKENGLRQPIVTLDEKILDGQNRLNACNAAKIEPVFQPFAGDDPLAFVISQNMNRRHLTDDQRAAIAAEIARAKPGNPANLAVLKSKPTIAEAAASLKVSPRNVARAKAVKKESPAAFKKVKSGEMSLNAAHEKKHPRKPTETKSADKELNKIGKSFGENCKKSEEKNLLAAVEKCFEISLSDFQKQLDILEGMIPANCNHKKYGVILNKATERQMNFTPGVKEYNPYGR